MNSPLLPNNETDQCAGTFKAAVVFIDTTDTIKSLESFREGYKTKINDCYRYFTNEIKDNDAEIYKTMDGSTAIAIFKGNTCCIDAVASVQATLHSMIHLNLRCAISYGDIHIEQIENHAEYVSDAIMKAARMIEAARFLKANFVIDKAVRDSIDKTGEFHFYKLSQFGPEASSDKEDIYIGLNDPMYLTKWDRCIESYREGDLIVAFMEFDLFNAETDHPVLQVMSSSCIEEIMKQLKEKESAFTEPQQYINHSGTQREQGEILMYLVGRALKSRKTVRRILDIGVGTGNLVSALREQYGDAELAGIDSSNEMLSYVSNRYKDDHRFSFRNVGIDDSAVLELGNFDVIVSNATMHWIRDQDKAYRNMHNLLNEDGIIAIHQGAEGCYKELYDLTEKALTQKGFQVPQGKFLSYHTIESIKFIEPLGFEIIDSRIMSEIPSATLIEDFSHAGMLPYLRGLNEEEKITVREDFIAMAKKLPTITVRRLYFVARKVNH